jgi:hypothetical protein
VTPVPTRAWNAAVATGLLRLVVGAGLFRWRHPLAERLGGAPADDRVVPLVFGYFGVRDMAVGVATLGATRPGGDIPRALRWQGLADATDAALVGALGAAGRLSRARAIGSAVVAVVSAAGGFVTAHGLRSDD